MLAALSAEEESLFLRRLDLEAVVGVDSAEVEEVEAVSAAELFLLRFDFLEAVVEFEPAEEEVADAVSAESVFDFFFFLLLLVEVEL